MALWVAGSPEVRATVGTPSEIAQLVNEDFAAYYSEHPAGSFALQVWVNNSWVALQCLAFAILLGIPIPYVLLQNAAKVGDHLRAALQRELGSLPGVKDIRGQGLMLGIELNKPCGALIGRAAEAGLLLSVTADSVIRLVPPLILTTAEADEIVAKLTPLVQAILAE